jgi:hypothetical protein
MKTNPQAFPSWPVHPQDGQLHYEGMTLLDFFAAQYMSAGKAPDEAFRLASQALKEREAYL